MNPQTYTRRTLRRTRTAAAALAVALATASCGDLFDYQPTVSPYKMTFDRHEYWIMAGDTGRIIPLFDPDTISNMTIYWMSADHDVVTFDDNDLVAVGQGETTVTGVSTEYQIYDTCHVYVMPQWQVDDTQGYAFDMVVYARVTRDGQPLNDRQVVAAFCGKEVRAVGERRRVGDIDFTLFRIYSRYNPLGPFNPDWNPQDPVYPYEPEEQPEAIEFRLYDHATQEMLTAGHTITFDGEAHGTLSNLYEINF